MPERPRCPDCGVELPPGSPRGLCPRCLLGAGLGDASARSSHGATGAFAPAAPGVLDTLAQSIGPVPRVLLRDTAPGEPPGPIVRPGGAGGDSSVRYRIDGEIARGGMGAVLKGRDPDLGREVALKVLRDDYRSDAGMVRRFVEEAQIGGQLQHPGIVPIYELGTFADQRPFFSMKLVKGHTLAELLAARKGPADGLPRLLGIFEQVCQTMAYAHARGVIHRDLKPSNVMVGSFGEVQVMDWGLAKVLPRGGVVDDAAAGKTRDETVIATARSGSDDPELSRAGSVLGTPSYMAPEQARGEVDEVDERADVFALGSILAEILTGQPAFVGRTSAEILRRAARGETVEAMARLDACGAEAELVVLARDCLSAEPDDRPGNASAVAERVAAHLAGVQERLRAAERDRAAAEARAAEQAKRRRVQAVLGLTFTGLILLGGAFAWWAVDQRRGRRLEAERSVNRSLETAVARLGQARGADGDPSLLAEARAAALQARERAAAGAPAELRDRAEAVLDEIDQAEKNRRLMATLHEIQTGAGDTAVGYQEAQGGSWIIQGGADSAVVDARYRSAFDEYGLDLHRLVPERAADLLRERCGESAAELAAALDDWANARRARLRRTHTRTATTVADEGGGPSGEQLVAIARRLDPDPLRNRVRDAAARSAGPALSALVGEIDPAAQPTQTIILLGVNLAWTGREDKAVRLYQAALLHHPGDFRIHDGLARYRAAQEQHDEALPHAMAAVALRPRSATALYSLAICLVALHRHDEAAAALLRFAESSPKDWVRLLALACQVEDDGAGATVEPVYRKTAELAAAHPVGTVGVQFLGILPRSRPVLAGVVLPRLRERLGLGPTAVAHATVAVFHIAVGRMDDAITALREALRLKPNDDPDGHAILASRLRQQGKSDEAAAEFREALRLRPGDPLILNEFASMLSFDRKPKEALALRREAVRLHPDDAQARVKLAGSLSDPAEARAEYREALRLEPDNMFTLVRYAGFLARQGRSGVEEATAIWRDAARREPDIGTFRFFLGECLVRQGNLADALVELREAVRLWSERDMSQELIGQILARQGHDAEAEAEFRALLRRKPELNGIRLMLGRVLIVQGKLADALVEYRELAQRTPDDGRLRLELGALVGRMGQRDEAVAEYRRGAELFEKTLAAEVAAGRLPAHRLRVVELIRSILPRLPGLLLGDDRPKDDAERLALAGLCYDARKLSRAARLWSEAFQSDPKLGNDLNAAHRYNAACAAALAGGGQDVDAAVDADARAGLRRQALEWLRSDLTLRRTQSDEGPAGRQEATQALRHWQQDNDLAGVRDADDLAKLPEAERKEWQALWAEVEALLERAGGKAP